MVSSRSSRHGRALFDDQLRCEVRESQQCTTQDPTPLPFANSVAASLPFCRITTGVQYGKHDNDMPFNGKVDGIRKAPEECSADTRPKFLVFQWTLDDRSYVACNSSRKSSPNPDCSCSYHWKVASMSRSARGSEARRYSITGFSCRAV